MSLRIFITGATRGIGKALAKYYLMAGHTVGIGGRNEELFFKEFANYGERAIFFKMDVTNRDQTEIVIKAFAQDGLDIVVANAGIAYEKKSKVPDWDRTIEILNTNAVGVIYTFDAALKSMLPRGRGQLVCISSVAGYFGLPGVSGYSASKAYVRIMCESLAIDLKQYGIDVTCVCPAFVDTDLTAKNPHHMPFLITEANAAKHIAYAVDKRKMLYAFPWQMGLICNFLKLLPRTCYRRLMSVKMFNYSRS